MKSPLEPQYQPLQAHLNQALPASLTNSNKIDAKQQQQQQQYRTNNIEVVLKTSDNRQPTKEMNKENEINTNMKSPVGKLKKKEQQQQM